MSDIKDAIKQELGKCIQDPIYFIKKYCYIQHPQRGRIKFELYPFQEDCLKQFVMYDKNIVLKSRQLGLSTLIAAYSLWMCLFFKDKNILVVATKQDVAKNLITKVRTMYSNLPSWMRKGMFDSEENNVLSVKFRTGSGIKAVSSASDAGRSESLSLLVADEMAFIQKVDDLWTSVQPTLSTGGKAILLSTPNGIGNLYHKIWVGAEQGINGFNPIKLKWTVHPERDQAWRDAQTAELGADKASQECLGGNTIVTIRNKETGLIEDITLDKLEEML